MTIKTDPNEPTETNPDEPQETAAEAMMRGIAEAEGAPAIDEPTADIMPPVNEEPKAADPPPTEAEPKPAETPAPDAALEAEMDKMGLKARSRERFAAITRENNELKPFKEALEAAGVKDAADIPAIIARAEAGTVFENAIQATGAPPAEFSQALNVLADMNSGDPVRQARGFDELTNVLKFWAPILGKTVDGVDPLAGHPELAEAVDNGEITMANATELARVRTVERLLNERREQQTRQQSEQVTGEQVETQARTDLTALGKQLEAQDPHYAAKFPALKAALVSIMENAPPERWVSAAVSAYRNLPTPAAAPAPAHRPLRPASPQTSIVPQFDDPLKAMMAGLASASGR